MLQELFDRQRSYIEHFFDAVDVATAEKIFEVLRDCKGTLCFTGIGKSGLVANKIAVTMISTGTKAQYISATNALHGDLGMVGEDDVIVLFSKSGESDELLNLVPFLRNKGATLVAVVSKAGNRLAKACHHSIALPVEQELCPFDLAPTTSTAIQMIFGDILTVALMRHKEFSLDQYALNHPAGRIGKRISLKVNDLMISGTRLPSCKNSDTLLDILGDLSAKGCGCVLVLDDDGLLLGIFTDGDLRRALQKYGPEVLQQPIGQIMTANPRTIEGEVLAWDAMQAMESDQNRAITVMPVVDRDRKVKGLIKMHDILQSGL